MCLIYIPRSYCLTVIAYVIHPVTLRFSDSYFLLVCSQNPAPYLILFPWIESCFLLYWVHRSVWREFHQFHHHFYPPNSIYALILCLPAGPHSDLVMFQLKADFSSSTWALDSIYSHLFRDVPQWFSCLSPTSWIFARCWIIRISRNTNFFSPISKTFFGTTFSTSHHPISLEQSVKGHIYLLVSLSSSWIFS